MQKPRDAGGCARGDQAARQLDVGTREFGAVGASAAAMQDANQIDDCVMAAYERRERPGIMDIGFNDVDRG
jgi:hypothetical protein